jgi:hypothetical protein
MLAPWRTVPQGLCPGWVGSAGRRRVAQNQLQQGGLARAIGAKQADLVATQDGGQ